MVETTSQNNPAADEAPELENFYRAGRFLTAILDIEELLRAILEEGLAAVRATRGFIGLINRSTGELDFRITAGEGWDPDNLPRMPITGEPGQSITGRVAATGVPYATGDVLRDPHYVMVFPDVRSELAVPLVNRDGRTVGVLNISSEQPDAFSERDLQLMGALASQASISISVANYRAREVALIEIGNELASISDMQGLIQCVARRTAEILRADDCSIFELSPEGDRLILRASGKMLEQHVGTATYRLGEGLTGWVAKHATTIRLANAREDTRWRGLYPGLPQAEVEAYMAVPVFRRDELWGVLRVLRRKPACAIFRSDFTERDERLLTTLARQVGTAIAHQSLIDQQVQMERMAAWGEMSARSAHMIGNKVFALKGQLNELQYRARQPGFSPEMVLEIVERATNSVYRLEEILTEYRDFLLATHVERNATDLNALLETVARENFRPGGPIEVHLDLQPGLPRVPADAKKLQRAISELLENSAHHQSEGGEIRITTRRWDRSAVDDLPTARPAGLDRGVRVEVSDRGPGVPEEIKGRLFTPFFTTRSKGMGLGLSIVKGIIDAHQGSISEVGKPGEGARFVILLPEVRHQDA
jgi:signal transduction histidine kinase